jgi:Ca2+-binding RTX toxin-like protein
MRTGNRHHVKRRSARTCPAIAAVLVLTGSLLSPAFGAAPVRCDIRGTAAGDRLRGGPAGDRIFGGAGHDVLRGQRGSDTLIAEDATDTGDLVHAGPGNDVCVVDGGDTMIGCETAVS